MNCPKCGRKMVELFVSAVCDHCNPPKAQATPHGFIDMKDPSVSPKRKWRNQRIGDIFVDEMDYGVDGGAPSITFTHYDLNFVVGFLDYENKVCLSAYDEGTGDYHDCWTLDVGECWTKNKTYMAILGALAMAGQTLDDRDLRDMKSAVDLLASWQKWH